MASSTNDVRDTGLANARSGKLKTIVCLKKLKESLFAMKRGRLCLKVGAVVKSRLTSLSLLLLLHHLDHRVPTLEIQSTISTIRSLPIPLAISCVIVNPRWNSVLSTRCDVDDTTGFRLGMKSA
jgi:hypothetical protein